MAVYGEGNFEKIKLRGKYQVGHQDFHLESGIAASVYYPMDKTEYQNNIGKKNRNTSWFRYDSKSLQGLVNAATDLRDFPAKADSSWFYSFTMKIKMDTCQNGKLSLDFSPRRRSRATSCTSICSGPTREQYDDNYVLQGLLKRDLVPVIFLHGLAGSRTSQSGSCRDLASHGYIVFSLDHFDGSAYYAEKKDGSGKLWPLDVD